ncbi:MAG TPA: hypothetical protein VK463_10470 [Desulfomonilaceae bacterium]|nr:hypothetical protein [Desulfomonilaceae bacterium]
MNRWIRRSVIVALFVLLLPALSFARGTRYFIDWPACHVGPVYVQIYDIRVTPPFELWDRFKVWVTWDNQTKCYDIGDRGTYLLKLYKSDFNKGPMIISGNASSFRIRYSLVPPWI